MTSAVRQAPSTRMRGLIAQAATRMDAREPQLARALSGVIAREVKDLDADDGLLEILHASTAANVKAIIQMLANSIPLQHVQTPTAAVEYALRLAQREIPGNSLVRAYTIGKDNFIEELFPDVQALECSPEDKFEVLHHMATVVGQYVDRVSQQVFDVYERERLRWISARGNVHASLVHEVLSRDTAPSRNFEAETGYKLANVHVAIVIWSVRDVVAPDELRVVQQAIRRLATVANCVAAPLVTAVDRTTAWAWLPFATVPDLERLTAACAELAGEAACRLSLGLPARGAAGFRRSHAQAQAARSVAAGPAVGAAPAVSFGDDGVAVTSLLARDLESTRAWITDVLGGLAEDDDRSRVLRETLRVFYLTGESYTDAAEQLNLHRNTVKYRVAKALDERDSSVAANRVDIAVALNACHFLGPAVLS